MGKQFQGHGKLYDNDGTNFISDARYKITVRHDSEGRQINNGTLFEIEFTTLIDIQDKGCVLHLEDGTPLKIHTKALSYPPEPFHLDFFIHSEIKL